MLEITITNEQKIQVTLKPVTATGRPAKLDGTPEWSVISGDSTLEVATDGLSAFLILAFVLTLFGGQVVDLVGRHVGPAAGVTALVVRWTITVAAVLLTVAAIYYACPAVEKDWQWIRPGAVLFTLGFAGTSAAFSYYVGHFASYDATYGSLGAVIILLAWTYILAVFLLLGGELNALVEERIHERNAAEAARTGEEQPEVQLAEEPPARVARY